MDRSLVPLHNAGLHGVSGAYPGHIEWKGTRRMAWSVDWLPKEKFTDSHVVDRKWHWTRDGWKGSAQLTPSIALALVNTVTNLALVVAIGQGIAIAWWRKALLGATVEDVRDILPSINIGSGADNHSYITHGNSALVLSHWRQLERISISLPWPH